MKEVREWMRQREREKETRGKEWVGKAWRCHGNWELSADSMFFHSFPTHLPPPDSLPLPVHSSFHRLTPSSSSPSSLYFLFSLCHDHTPFTFLTHTSPPHPPRLLSLSTSTTPWFHPSSPSPPSLASFPPTRSPLLLSIPKRGDRRGETSLDS